MLEWLKCEVDESGLKTSRKNTTTDKLTLILQKQIGRLWKRKSKMPNVDRETHSGEHSDEGAA